MTTVKVVLGFVELAFALKFLSVADMAYGWHILDREVFIAVWVSLSLTLALYLMGIVKIGADMTEDGIGAIRLACAVAALSFTIYLIPGLWGAPLKAVSAFCPPMSTQDFVMSDNVPHAEFTDFESGMAEAKRQGKYALIDFTGYGCVNCRKMEQSVWTDANVSEIMKNDFILISLYVDDKTPLPEHIMTSDGDILRTTGDKWSRLQRDKFGVNAQPYYVILDENGKMIGSPYTFDEDASHFLEFLKANTKK